MSAPTDTAPAKTAPAKTAPAKSAPTRAPHDIAAPGQGRVGDSPLRPDGTLKVKGEFAYSSDLFIDGMLWGATLRSPHPRARILSIDISNCLLYTSPSPRDS